MRWGESNGNTDVGTGLDHCTYADCSATDHGSYSSHPGSHNKSHNGAYSHPHFATYLGANVT
ncbi:MAG: hypothetical protein IH873_11040 [Chloroflexi bacterium]|nr:hypothetical protein [Chloroflexota bacterium]